MWRNPKYPAPEPTPPPEPSGELLISFPRPGRGRGPDAELRVSLDEFQGHPFVSVRLWNRGPDGSWYPTKKGCSVRLAEAEDLADVLAKAAQLAGKPAARPRAASTPRRGGPARQPEPSAPGRSPYGPGFNEFT